VESNDAAAGKFIEVGWENCGNAGVWVAQFKWEVSRVFRKPYKFLINFIDMNRN